MKTALALLLAFTSALRAEIYQYAVPAKDVAGKEITALLWVPPGAERLRGILIGGATLTELSFAKDPALRTVCAAEQLGIVLFAPPLDPLFNYRENDVVALFRAALTDLAEQSGYEELTAVPWFPFGHSAGTVFASRLVCWAPDRCFGALLFKGGIDTTYDPRYAGVPILAIKGQFEEFGPGPSGVLRDHENRETSWKLMRDALLGLRAKDQHHLVSLLVEPGATHFAWSPGCTPIVTEFIRQCARQRIPAAKGEVHRPVKCQPIDPESITNSNPKAFWHLDANLARAVEGYGADQAGKKPQFVTFAEPGKGTPIVIGHDMRLRIKPVWTGPDTFQVAGTFLDKTPAKYPTAPAPVGHVEGPVLFRTFGGAVEQTGPDTFRVTLDGRASLDAEILAYHPGNSTYRYTEQPGRVRLPVTLTAGTAQTITFPSVPAIQAGAPPVKLLATSSAGLPVRYYVESGPAIVKGDMLQLSEVPLRVTYPVRVVVVAYQYGSAVEPLVQSAKPVRQMITVEK